MTSVSGAGFTEGGHDFRPELNVGLRGFTDFKSDLERLALEAGCDGQYDIGERGRRVA